MATTGPWLSEDEQRAWRAFLRVQTELNAALSRQLAESSDLSLADYEILVQLSEATDDQLRVTDLARCLDWERSRVSHQLRRMSERGLIARRDCPTDGRVGYVLLTEHGRAELERAAPGHAAAVRGYLFDDVPGPELAAVRRFLQRTLTRLASAQE
ncbi:MAG: MarR family winged helix-turn-helix transcriptional regulator [Actinomycetales bacterium]